MAWRFGSLGKIEEVDATGDRMVRVGCPAHNCGGRCVLLATVREGRIVRLEADDRPDELAAPQLRACARGRAYLRRQYHPDRLLHPLKRVGKRGEGKFARVPWDEALDLVASQMRRVRDEHGGGALFVPYGTGSYNQTNGSHVARRLMNCAGGCLGIWNSYSWAATNVATPTVYGTLTTGNQRQDWLNARLILMWGWNPAEMRDGTNSDYFLKLARQRGARVVCIDPRHSLSASALADEWVPIRPGTDAAMMTAMAFVMVQENLYDEAFVRTHCVGFDSGQMPPGCEGEESYWDYLFGLRDGVPKTPEWAQEITAVPSRTIVRLAREYATRLPGVLYQGYGMQRRAYGEQVVRAGCVLAALAGNVGVPGGWASGLGNQAPDGGPLWTLFPTGENPVGAAIPCFLWTEAVLRGREMGEGDGVVFDGNVARGRDAAALFGSGDAARRLGSDVKLIYAVATNALINQHANVNRTARILADESLVEFLAVQDNFLTPTARFADVVLPACTQFETWGVEDGWKYGDEVILMPKLVDPPGECWSDYRICAELAGRLGVGEAFTEGRDERGWVEWCLDRYRETRFPDLPSLDELLEKNAGVWAKPVTAPAVAFEDFRRDPEGHPLATPSGKIEIFSRALFEKRRPAEIPPVPKYIQEWESPFDPEARRFPLQVIGHHTLHRVHSTHDNNDWLEEAFPQRVFLNPLDAKDRGIGDGDAVRVFNDRGAAILKARLTPRIMPGVIDVPQGAWWTPGADGEDGRGSANVLTSERWTPLAFGTAQHTAMAQVERQEHSNLGSDERIRPEGPRMGASRFTGAEAGAGPYAVHFDASSCAGCKACQEACKDHNALPPGLLWRRVYEVAGGGWAREGGAWVQDVFAYHLSLSCNHCERPICAEVCPTGALRKRADGAVLLDERKCMGCRCCSWACPYAAPRFDEARGVMTKCTLCPDRLEEGLPPSCVSACPMRALDFGTRDELEARYGASACHPLPEPSLTEPALLVTPHASSPRGPREGRVANAEEVEP